MWDNIYSRNVLTLNWIIEIYIYCFIIKSFCRGWGMSRGTHDLLTARRTQKHIKPYFDKQKKGWFENMDNCYEDNLAVHEGSSLGKPHKVRQLPGEGDFGIVTKCCNV